MFEKWKAVRRAKKEAAAKAKEVYLHQLKLKAMEQDFLNGDDDPNFIGEIFKGIAGHQNIKVIYIKKVNGTTITIPLSDDYGIVKKTTETDWINFDSLTDSQGIMRIE